MSAVEKETVSQIMYILDENSQIAPEWTEKDNTAIFYHDNKQYKMTVEVIE